MKPGFRYRLTHQATLAKQCIGAEACVYRFGIDEGNTYNSLWLYEFYDAHWVTVKTGDVVENAF